MNNLRQEYTKKTGGALSNADVWYLCGTHDAWAIDAITELDDAWNVDQLFDWLGY